MKQLEHNGQNYVLYDENSVGCQKCNHKWGCKERLEKLQEEMKHHD